MANGQQEKCFLVAGRHPGRAWALERLDDEVSRDSGIHPTFPQHARLHPAHDIPVAALHFGQPVDEFPPACCEHSMATCPRRRREKAAHVTIRVTLRL